ncbi:MAG: DMT family transporter [Pseudomonadota bacterium]
MAETVTRGAGFGLGLALLGTLVLTPDAMLMRLSGMDGFQMSAWRGFLMGGVMLLAWWLISRDRLGDLRQITTTGGVVIVICQFFNSMLFCLGIAAAPAAIVLIGIAAVPVFSALLSWGISREPTSALTWGAIAAVIVGLLIAVSGKGAQLNATAVIGVLFGLGVAFVLALNFTILRAHQRLPILLLIGVGAVLAGINGLIITGPANMVTGAPWAMVTTGAVVLPLSFYLLSLSARYTHAANVSLIMLMETVLGPFWVWLAVGEVPTGRMIVGGAIVLMALAIYLILARRRAFRAASMPAPP